MNYLCTVLKLQKYNVTENLKSHKDKLNNCFTAHFRINLAKLYFFFNKGGEKKLTLMFSNKQICKPLGMK